MSEIPDLPLFGESAETEGGGVNESPSDHDGQQMSPLQSPEVHGSGRSSVSTSPPAASAFEIEMVEIASLKTHARAYRSHPPDQLEHLARSLRTHGCYRPILIARDGTILAGRGITTAAKEWLGWTEIPARRLDIGPEDPEALKILAGDDEVGNLAETNDRARAEVLKHVKDSADEGLLGTGFDSGALANLALVTRPASELADKDEAAHWVGMPAFEKPVEERCKLVVSFTSDDDRLKFLELINHQGHRHVRGKAISIWWPDKPRQDLYALRFDDLLEIPPDINDNIGLGKGDPEPIDEDDAVRCLVCGGEIGVKTRNCRRCGTKEGETLA